MNSRETLELLVSVRDEQEALDAIAGGADWIDCKEPRAGSLGAVPVGVARRTAEIVNGFCPLSAALGELTDWQDSSTHELLLVPEIQVVKLGVRGCANEPDWQTRWHEAYDEVRATGKQLAAVIYADWQHAQAPTPEKLLDCAIAAGCRYLLVDTFHKHLARGQAASSLEFFSREELKRLMQVACGAGMTTVLAGNLRSDDFVHIIGLPVQIVAVRGAVCRGDRSARIDSKLVHELRMRLNTIISSRNNLPAALTRSD